MIKRYPFYQQVEQNSCGISCIRMVLASHQTLIHDHQIKNECVLTKTGLSIHQMVQAFNSFGFKSKALQGTYESLLEMDKRPMIAHVIVSQCSHFVVLYRIHKKFVVIGDPATKVKKLKRSVFEEMWTGVVVDVIKVRNMESDTKQFKSFVLELFYTERWHLLKYFSISMVGVLLQLMVASYQRILLEDGFLFQPIKQYFFLFGTMGFIFMSYNVLMWVKNTMLIVMQKRLDQLWFHDPRIAHIKQSASFFSQHDVGDFMTRHDYLERLKLFLMMLMSVITIDLVGVIALFFMLAFIQVRMVIFVSIVLMIQAGISLYYHKQLITLQRKLIPIEAHYQLSLHESFMGHSTIRQLNAQRYFEKRLSFSYRQLMNQQIRLGQTVLTLNQIKQWVLGMTSLMTIFILFRSVVVGESKIGSVLFIMMIMNMLMNHVAQVLALVEKYEGAKKGYEVYISLESNQKELEVILKTVRKISYKNVSFAYPNRSPSIHSFSHVFSRHTLIIGPSGCGKSTLMKLMIQEMKPNSGSILMDDVDYLNYHSQTISTVIGFVEGRSTLYQVSIKENIVLGDDTLLKRMYQMIKYLQLENLFLGKEMNLEMILDQSGKELSNGQRQLVHLMRFLVRDYDVLILDEATSMMDKNLEMKILFKVKKLYEKRLLILISHRYNKLEGFDVVDLKDHHA